MECARQGVANNMTRALTDLQTEWDAWHSDREAELAKPHGWLSLRSLQWLTPEPSPAEGVPGLWSATPDGVVITATPADDLVVRSVREPRRIDGTVTLHPVDGKPGTLVEHGDLVVEVVRRTDTHALRLRDPAAATRTAFTGVPAFPVDDQEQRLVALAGPDGALSLHFLDATSGVSTYPGGRILKAEAPGPDGELTLDFNRVVNLPCAFTEFATCPLPPAGNTLTVAVEAGEQLPA